MPWSARSGRCLGGHGPWHRICSRMDEERSHAMLMMGVAGLVVAGVHQSREFWISWAWPHGFKTGSTACHPCYIIRIITIVVITMMVIVQSRESKHPLITVMIRGCYVARQLVISGDFV